MKIEEPSKKDPHFQKMEKDLEQMLDTIKDLELVNSELKSKVSNREQQMLNI